MVLLILAVSACSNDSSESNPPSSDKNTANQPPKAKTEQVAADSKASKKAPATPKKRTRIRRLGSMETPSESDWEPENYNLPDPATDINLALQQAENAIARDELVEPAKHSALDFLLSVLQREPTNQQALESMSKLEKILLQRANTNLDKGSIREALKFANGLKRIKPTPAGMPALQARLQQARRMTRLLTAAADAIEADHLVAPVENNALYFYRQVLAVSRKNADALKGLEYVEAELLKRSRAAAKGKDFATARRWLSMASDVRDNSAQVLRVKIEVDDLQATATNAAADQVRAALKNSDTAAAKSALAELEKVLPPKALFDDLKEKVRILDVYGSFAPGEVFSDPATAALRHPVKLVVIPAGEFSMGSPQDEIGRTDAEGPQRTIRIAEPFAMMQTEVTVAEFGDFIVAAGYRTDAERLGDSVAYDDDANAFQDDNNVSWKRTYDGKTARPDDAVLHVSWNDATRYAQWISAETGFTYRLPSEAQFEYALRAGSKTRFWWGNGGPPEVLENTTGSRDRSKNFNTWEGAFYGYGDKFWGPSPVGSFKPNAFGLYDMAGNATEWMADCWYQNLTRIPVNGSAYNAPGCRQRVLRGGSYASNPQQARSAFRRKVRPETRHAQIGFRLVRSLDTLRAGSAR